MVYCPKCGFSLKGERVRIEFREKHEKHEKHEKEEKAEKHEKGETGRFWMLIGGLIIIVLGALSLITKVFGLPDPWQGAFFLLIVGALIVIFALYGAFKASSRNPRP